MQSLRSSIIQLFNLRVRKLSIVIGPVCRFTRNVRREKFKKFCFIPKLFAGSEMKTRGSRIQLEFHSKVTNTSDSSFGNQC